MKKNAKKQKFLIEGPRLALRKLELANASKEYLSWLNDPQVQEYTSRRGKTLTWDDMTGFLEKVKNLPDWHMAIVVLDGLNHIGNISLTNINHRNSSAELSIMIGDRSVWGKAYAREAISLAVRFAFKELGLNRVWAESPNPAFNRVVYKLGWKFEGKRNEAFKHGNEFIDLECWAIWKDTKGSSRTVSTVLLMNEDSPLGLRYLEAMLVKNLVPNAVVVSRLEKLTKLAAETVRQKTNGLFSWPKLEDLLVDCGIPVYFVKSHNSELSAKILESLHPDLAILGGTGIIKKNIIKIPRLGIINSHPGILPKYRGLDAVEWSILNDDPVGTTCHLIDEGIDSGLIITAKKLKISKKDNYYQIRVKAYENQIELLLEGLKLLAKPDFKDHLLQNEGDSYFSKMSEADLAKVKEKILKHTYKHYVD